MALKSGIRTTEFWVTALTTVGSIAAFIAGLPITAPTVAIAAAVSSSAYAISRGLAKSKNP